MRLLSPLDAQCRVAKHSQKRARCHSRSQRRAEHSRTEAYRPNGKSSRELIKR
jgi:hypothetical protein